MRSNGITRISRIAVFMAVAGLTLVLIGVGEDIEAAQAGEAHIAVLVSNKGAPYEEALNGFRKFLRDQGTKARYSVYNLEGNAAKATRAVQEMRSGKPDLVFSVGTLATEAALKDIPDIPVIAGMVLRCDRLKKRNNAAVVCLEFPLEVQFKWLRRMLPEARTVGVLYNPGENRQRVEAAARVASTMGLQLEPREVNSPQDLPAALESLGNRADVLWGLSDTVAFTPGTAKYVLLFSFRNRIPVVGLSASWVKAGAMYSLEWDFDDMGRQCGEIAQSMLRGNLRQEIDHAPPRKTAYALNLNTARQMKIQFPEAIVRGAKKVFSGGD